MTTRIFLSTVIALGLSLSACSSDSNTNANTDGVASPEQAKQAYVALDSSIDTAIALGLKGFSEASSANITPQTASGKSAGTLTVTGHVDQGASSNKTMSLNEALQGYSDDGKISFTTDAAALPTLDMKLSKIPDGTMTGSLAGAYTMSGALAGRVDLTVTFTADLQADPAAPTTGVQRKPGTTHITGTAKTTTSTFAIDVTK